MSLEKAEEFQKAAQRCLEEGWYNSAVNRAYYAMFQAARAALATAGIDRPWWRHGSLQAIFFYGVGATPEALPTFFRELFDRGAGAASCGRL